MMSTITPLAVRMGRRAVRAALSTVFAALAAGALLAGLLTAPVGSASAADDFCPAVEVLFARGTNEAPGVGATGQAFVDALNARLPGENGRGVRGELPGITELGHAADGIVDASNKIQSIAAAARAPRSCSADTHKAPRWPATPPPMPFRPDSICRPVSPARCHPRSPPTSRPWSCSERRTPGF